MNLLRCAHLSRWEFNKLMLIILVDLHYTGLISTSVTVIGSWPYCEKRFVPEVVSVPFLHELMGSCNSVHSVDMKELLCDLFRKQVPCTSIAYWPAINVGIRIWPYQIAHVARLWNLSNSFYWVYFV